MLTFVFVGGGFAGIEALGEVEDMARAAVKYYKAIEQEELRFVLVEGSPRILPEVSEELGGYTLEQLRKRDIEIHLSTFLNSCVDGHVVLSNKMEFDAETIVWTAGVKANPVLQNSDLPLDKMGRVTCNASLQVVDAEGTVGAGRVRRRRLRRGAGPVQPGPVLPAERPARAARGQPPGRQPRARPALGAR